MVDSKQINVASFCRRWSNGELENIGYLFGGSVVNVSAWTDEDKEGRTYRKYFPNAKSYALTNYGGYRGKSGEEEIRLDLEKELPKELVNKFDVVFNHTTLEHIFDFWTAFKNLCLMTKDILILVVPWKQELHCAENEGYLDYWRFSEDALKRLCRENEFGILKLVKNKPVEKETYLFLVASKNVDLWKNIIN